MECMGIGGLGAWLIYKKHLGGRNIKKNIALMLALIFLNQQQSFLKHIISFILFFF